MSVLHWRKVSASSDTVEIVDDLERYREGLESRHLESPKPIEVPEGYPPPLAIESVTLEQASLFTSAIDGRNYRHDPRAIFLPMAHTRTTRSFPEHPAGSWLVERNDIGTRDDEDLGASGAPLRVLVAGDSHTAGVVPTEETFANVLEARLIAAGRPAEVLNAGVGGYNLYNYLGLVENHLVHRPRVVVVCVYGGNDFSGAMRLQRYFSRRTPPNLKQPFPFARLTEHREQHQGPIAQELSQAGYFLDNPEDVQVAIDTMAALHLELARRCRESDARLLLVYLPPGFATQPETYAELYEAALSDLGLPRTSTEVSDRIADSWLAWALGQGLEVLDLRQAFAGVAEPLFWFADLHLNTRGHELVAETLHPLVERLSD